MISTAQWLNGLVNILQHLELYVKGMRREDILEILLEREDILTITQSFSADTMAAFLNHYQGMLAEGVVSPAVQEAIRRLTFEKLLKHPNLQAILYEYVKWTGSSYKDSEDE